MKRLYTIASLFIISMMAMAQGENAYTEDFDGAHYDGKSYLPIGWETSGDQPFYTLSLNSLPAHSGKYYAISIDINKYVTLVARNDWMNTCAFALEGGVKYTGSYWLHNDKDGPSTVSFTVGSTQEIEDQQVLHTTSSATTSDWQEMKFEYTPEKSGNYYFGWNVSSPDRRTTFVAIDDFCIIEAWKVNLPKASFALPHIYNISTGALLTSPGQKVKLDNTSVKATSYKWECSNPNVKFSDDTAAEPTITFDGSGKYKITLNAINETGAVSTSHEINVESTDDLAAKGMTSYGVTTYDGWTDELIQRGTVPCFKTDLDYDYVTGPNHLYREFAERYAFPEGVKMNINTLNVFLTEYSLRTDMWQTQQNVPLEVIVYAEKDGKPDEDHIYGKTTTTFAKCFGTTGVGGTSAEPRNIVLDKPITVEGPAYISFRVGDDFCIDDDGKQVIRSYFCLAPIRKAKTSTMIVKPYYLPGGIADKTLEMGDWCTAAQLDADMPAALGMYNIAWVSYDVAAGIEGVDEMQNADCRMLNHYNLAGQRVAAGSGYKGIIIKNGKKILN